MVSAATVLRICFGEGRGCLIVCMKLEFLGGKWERLGSGRVSYVTLCGLESVSKELDRAENNYALRSRVALA